MIEDHKWPKEEAALIKALWNGTSDAHAQRRAIQYVVEVLGSLNQVPFVPGSPDLTAFNAGRMWVARQLQIAITVPIDRLVKEENNEPRTTGVRTATDRASNPGTGRRRNAAR